ncbi:MAG: glutamyl-tRNA reductase [Candidatus Xenobium sp.]|jgi:glutamyl-tRNA reductase/hydroxymethylbilane synthase|nr:glutamyl-tRNA reductase [Burkholderiales bacterium]
MGLLLVGLNHKTAPLVVRERLAFGESGLESSLTGLLGNPAIQEGVILSTCNRTEIYVSTPELPEGERQLLDFLALSRGVEPEEFRPHLYRHAEDQAVAHLFAVASGLDSMIPGENQVLGQVRKAWETARNSGATGPHLDRLFPWAVRVGRRARSQTRINQGAASISHAAAEMARTLLGDLARRTVLVLGAGKTSELTLRHLTHCGVQRVSVSNRTDARARELARRCGVHAVPFEDLDRTLADCDILLTSTGAPHFILTRERLERLMQTRPARPLFIMDIALPRDVEPSCADLEQVHLYNLDDLQQAVARNLSHRHEEVAEVTRMVEEETREFLRDLAGRRAVPAIRKLREHVEALRQEELERARAHGLNAETSTLLENFSRNLVRKLLHQPTRRLREMAADGEDPSRLQRSLALFGLESPLEAPIGSSPEVDSGRPLLRLGTRGSDLAMAQSQAVADALRRAWPELEVRLEVIRTTGDRIQDRALSTFGGKGIFTRELEDALLEGRIDLAVHSLKDLPGTLPAGLALASPPRREDPRDCLVGPPLSELPPGARIGTGSPRRRAQLLSLRGDLRCLEIRGNLPTRIRKWQAGDYDALVLAQAGLNRLGLERLGLKPDQVHPLEPEECLPAAGQGLLGLEYREDDESTRIRLQALADPESTRAAQAERAFLEELQGGCQAPVAALARLDARGICLEALVAAPSGEPVLRRRDWAAPENSAELGRRIARKLLDSGARRWLPGTENPERKSPGILEGRRIVVTRAAEQAGELADRLAAQGGIPLLVPTIRLEDPEDPAPLDQALAELDRYDWLVLTSPNAPLRLQARLQTGLAGLRARIACIGPSTARAVQEYLGRQTDLLSREYVAEGLLEAFRAHPLEGRQILLARAAEARDVLPGGLRERGARVDVVPLYRTVALEDLPSGTRQELLEGVDLVTVTASSVVRAFHRLTEGLLDSRKTPLAALGPITAQTARELGYERVGVAPEATLDSLVQTAIEMLA